MAMNPMQRKANNYLLLGIFGTLVVTGIIIVFLFMQLNNLKKEREDIESSKKTVYVLKQDVKSGEILQESMFEKKNIESTTIPANATQNVQTMMNSMSLEDQYGRSISTDKEGMYYASSNTRIQQDGDGGYYYIDNNNKVYVELTNSPIIAKVDMKKNTVVTPELMTKADEMNTSDMRKQEYNMIILPSQIGNGDYIDIRLMLSTGADLIVVSKKQVTIPEIDGIPAEHTISVNLSEAETMTLSNAIVEAYIDAGSYLYATTYIEPGMQETATPTYVPSDTVRALVQRNDNITQEAKNALVARYNTNSDIRYNVINPTIAQYEQDRVDNIEAGIQERITRAREERERYLESLGGY